jgi:hypothetical protein
MRWQMLYCKKRCLGFCTTVGSKITHFSFCGTEKNACDRHRSIPISALIITRPHCTNFTSVCLSTKSCNIRFCIQNFGIFLNLGIVKTNTAVPNSNSPQWHNPPFKCMCIHSHTFGILSVYDSVPYIRLRYAFNSNLWCENTNSPMRDLSAHIYGFLVIQDLLLTIKLPAEEFRTPLQNLIFLYTYTLFADLPTWYNNTQQKGTSSAFTNSKVFISYATYKMFEVTYVSLIASIKHHNPYVINWYVPLN